MYLLVATSHTDASWHPNWHRNIILYIQTLVGLCWYFPQAKQVMSIPSEDSIHIASPLQKGCERNHQYALSHSILIGPCSGLLPQSIYTMKPIGVQPDNSQKRSTPLQYGRCPLGGLLNIDKASARRCIRKRARWLTKLMSLTLYLLLGSKWQALIRTSGLCKSKDLRLSSFNQSYFF